MAKVIRGVQVDLKDLVFDDILDIQVLKGSYESIQVVVAEVTHIAPLGWMEKIEDGKIVSLHFFDNMEDLVSMNFDASVLDVEVGQYIMIHENREKKKFNLYAFEVDEDTHAFVVAWMIDRICKIAPEMLEKEGEE